MELYHCLNRGVDGRKIFLDEKDRVRFIHDLFEFNTTSPAGSTYYLFENLDLRNPDFGEEKKATEKLVDIHGWCLMKNHYHLLLSERIEGGLSLFLRKLNVGYANYFNERHARQGTLFQGRTKKIPIIHDAHYLYILHYIHLNPLDYLKGAEEWRIRSKGKTGSLKGIFAYLGQYRWSSYLDYSGQHNFPSVLTTSLFYEIKGEYLKSLEAYLQDLSRDEEVLRALE
jgi:putative transposase